MSNPIRLFQKPPHNDPQQPIYEEQNNQIYILTIIEILTTICNETKFQVCFLTIWMQNYFQRIWLISYCDY